MGPKKKNSPNFSHKRSPQELWQELLEQYESLKDFGACYDRGKLFYAKHLASVVYTLVKDGGINTQINPILEQLGLRSKINYITTAINLPPGVNMASSSRLAVMSSNEEGWETIAHCQIGTPPFFVRWVGFTEWWNELVYQDQKGRKLTRHIVVNRLRSKDGGGHFDAVIDDETYHAFKTDPDPRIRITHNGNIGPIQNAHLATMRQIAWELEESLKSIVIAAPPIEQL